jgi:hypothetical protein
MRRNTTTLLLLLAAGCATTPPPAPLTGDEELDAFAREVERNLENHAWQSLLARADPEHYRIQVVDGGMPEPQYLAELFGLHRVDNDIGGGEPIGWEHLARIDAVHLESLSDTEPRRHLTGVVTLDDGSSLRLDAQITEVQGRRVLTGGVG